MLKRRKTIQSLGGGFNPFEKHYSNWIISPGFGVKIKKHLKPPPRSPKYHLAISRRCLHVVQPTLFEACVKQRLWLWTHRSPWTLSEERPWQRIQGIPSLKLTGFSP